MGNYHASHTLSYPKHRKHYNTQNNKVKISVHENDPNHKCAITKIFQCKDIDFNDINNGITGVYISTRVVKTAAEFWEQHIFPLSHAEKLEIGCAIYCEMIGQDKETKQIFSSNSHNHHSIEKASMKFVDMMDWLLLSLLHSNTNVSSLLYRLGSMHKDMGINHHHFDVMLKSMHHTFSYYFPIKYNIQIQFAMDHIIAFAASLMSRDIINNMYGHVKYSRNQLQFLDSLEQCLLSNIGREYLYTYLQTMYSDDIKIFLTSLSKFKTSISDKQRFMIARSIIKDSIKSDAPSAINISYDIRCTILTEMLHLEKTFLEKNNLKVSKQMFAAAEVQIHKLIMDNYWTKFKQDLEAMMDDNLEVKSTHIDATEKQSVKIKSGFCNSQTEICETVSDDEKNVFEEVDVKNDVSAPFFEFHESDSEQTHILSELEVIINNEIENVITICNQFVEFKKTFLLKKNNGVRKCPGSNDKTDQNSSGTHNNCNTSQKGSSDRMQNINRNNKNDEKKENDKNDDEKNIDDHKSNNSTFFHHCDHLNQCQYCNKILVDKNECIKKMKVLIDSLQKQHEYHRKFENVITRAHCNKTERTKLKKQFKEKKINNINAPSYHPSTKYRAKGNIKISKTMTNKMIPNKIKFPITNIYRYLDKSIAMQYNDKQINMNDDCQIVNVDFQDNNSNILFCVLRKQHISKSEQYKWVLDDKLYPVQEIHKLEELCILPLPQSSRCKHAFVESMKQITFKNKNIRRLIRSCKWKDIPVYRRSNQCNTQRITLSITQEKLNPLIKKTLNNISNKQLIPILMFNNHKHWVEYIFIVNIQKNISIGISLQRNAQNALKITGIHLDKEIIFEQHELVSPHNCHCLDGFVSIIHDIRVGNPNALADQMKNYKQRYETFKQFICKFIVEKMPENYTSLQKQAEMFIKNDNGQLSEICVSPSATLSSTLSSSSETSIHCIQEPYYSQTSQSSSFNSDKYDSNCL
eukprot:268081_1